MVECVFLRLPFMLAIYSSQQSMEMNNLVSNRDYALVSYFSPSGRHDLLREVVACVIRVVSLLNQLVVDPEEFLTPFILS